MHRFYDVDFATSHVRLTESDLEFGRRYGLLKNKEPALNHLFPIEDIPLDWSASHEKWRLVAMLWAKENLSKNPRELFDEIDTIWSYFNEPKDMLKLISFMPAEDANASYSSLEHDIISFINEKDKIYGLL